MREITITVAGTPAPQGSKRHVGNGVMIEMSQRLRPWRNDVMIAATEAMKAHPARTFPFMGPVRITADFYFRRPKSHYRTGRNAHLLRDTAPVYHTQAPDWSKLLRATEDALTDCGLWEDDRLVCRVGEGGKHWTGPGEAILPGAVIRVCEVTP